MKFGSRQTRYYIYHFAIIAISLLVLIIFPCRVFSVDLSDDFLLEDSFDLELEDIDDPTDFSDIEIQIDTKYNEGRIDANAIESVVTLGSFNREIVGIRSSELKIDLVIESSFDVLPLGYIELSANFELRSDGNKVSPNLNLFSIQNSIGNFKWQVGKYRKGWGDVDGVPVLDVINPLNNFTDQNLPQSSLPSRWLADLAYFSDKFTSEIFFSLNRDTMHSVNSDQKNSGSELGLKSSFDIDRGQVSIYLGSLFPRAGVISVSSGKSSSNRYNILGLSAHHEISSYLLKFDIAKKLGLERSSLTGIINDDRVDAAFGIEYSPDVSDQVIITLSRFLWSDRVGSYYIPGYGGLTSEEDASSFYSVVYSKDLLDQDLKASISIGGNFNEMSFYVSGESSYSISDRTKLKANFLALDAKPGDPSFLYNGALWVNLGISRYF